MEARTVRAACPHDCPDTARCTSTVDEDGRATHVAGDPDHPITAGFLCGKVSNYLDRVYAEDRILQPLVRTAPKGAATFREASWDEALDVAAPGCARIERHGGESILPYSYMGTQGVHPGRLMSAPGDERARRQRARADDLRDRRDRRRRRDPRRSRPRSTPRSGRTRATCSCGAGTRCRPRRTCGASCSTRAEPGAKLVVVDPFRSRTARVADEHLPPLPGTDAALALGMMRAIVDAGLADEEWCRAHADGYDELLARLGGVADRACAAGDLRRAGRGDRARRPRVRFARSRRCCGSASARSATSARPRPTRTIACLPALAGAWRHRGGGCSYIPTATAAAVSSAPLQRADLRAGTGAHDQHVAARRRADRPGSSTRR